MIVLHAFIRYIAAPVLITNAILYTLAFCLPSSLANGHPKRLATFFARAFAFIWSLLLCAAYGIIISLVLRFIGKPGLAQWAVARAFKYVMFLSTGVWITIEDEFGGLKTRPMVLIGNHQTELDILFLGHLFPPYTSVTAKASLKWTPMLGQFMWASKTIFIDRANSKSARAAFDGAAKEIKSSYQSVYIFVEGTRSYSVEPTLLPFKKGAFHLAIQAQVPLVPVVCENYAHILVMKGGWKKWKFESGTIRVKVLEKVETKGLDATAVDRLLEEIRERMLSTIVQLGRERAQTQSHIAMAANGKKYL
ncbi:uncharacterized protein PV09_04394 [Verruconis gallopava]|uniref:1-acyl-sn-glycerol-3-phosphate acyltransferase n=1 Tax=Verruconis gallopava TaxID=253628 RepID=A0A0D2AZW4_9PEZI|nr:uncharacterized protein PV09_04394 [Verruconis gallopava]KIW04649.1 hypothetical protein PV09_04394 [Verruconis gallopava]